MELKTKGSKNLYREQRPKMECWVTTLGMREEGMTENAGFRMSQE